MSKCAKCGYIRTQVDDFHAPPGKCPQCGTAYPEDMEEDQPARLARPPEPKKPTPFQYSTCPKCSYERSQADNEYLSRTECPSCGVTYTQYRSPDEKPFQAKCLQCGSTSFPCECDQKFFGAGFGLTGQDSAQKRQTTATSVSRTHVRDEAIQMPSRGSETQQDQIRSALQVIEEPKTATDSVWLRYLARKVDYCIFVTIMWFSMVLFSKRTPHLNTFLAIQTLGIGLLWNMVEASLLANWGSTPGKWLLGMNVKSNSGGNLPFPKALKRSLLVWLVGAAAVVPILVAIPQLVFFFKLRKGGIAPWDRSADSTVIHSGGKRFSVFIAVLIIFGSVGFWRGVYKARHSNLTKYETNGFTSLASLTPEEALKASGQIIRDATSDIRKQGETPELLTVRGIAYIYAGDLQGAFNDFNSALRIDPRYADAYAGRGWVYQEANQFDNAIEDFKYAATLGSEEAQNFFDEMRKLARDGNQNVQNLLLRHGLSWE